METPKTISRPPADPSVPRWLCAGDMQVRLPASPSK